MKTIERLKENKLIAVLRGYSPSEIQDVVEQLLQGGIRTIEITMDSPDPAESIQQLSEKRNDALVGAGTVLTQDELNRAEEAGAAFAFSPVFDPQIVTSCLEADIVPVPGCMTPSEIMEAYRCGARLVKVFPASNLGPSFLGSVGGLLPDDLSLIPTGGVDASNAAEFMKAGAVALGVGSYLTDDEVIEERGHEGIRRRAETLLTAIGER